MGRFVLLAVLLATSGGSAAAQGQQAGTNDAPAAAPPAVPQTGPLRVAVVPGIAVNLDTARVDALSGDLAEALMNELEVQASGGLEVRRKLPAEGVPPDCVTTPACIADVARRTGASQLLFVVMVDSGVGGSIQIDTTWVDPATNASASRPAIDLTSTTEAKEKFEGAAHVLLPDAPVRPKPKLGGGGGVTAMTEGVPRHLTTPAKITAAVAVVGLGAGIAFGISTRSKYDACEKNIFTCSDGKRDSIRNFGIMADVGFVVATGAAIATVVLYVTSYEEPRFVVTPTSDGAAVSAFGRF
jgi:hypothetical protein